MYRNIQVHHRATGALANKRKEALRLAFAEVLAKGEAALEEADKWLLEVRLTDWETSDGEQQEYWLVAAQAALEAAALRADRRARRGRGRKRSRA